MLNKIYEEIKKIIKTSWISILVLLVVIFVSFYKLPYVVYSPGGFINLNDRIVLNTENKPSGRIGIAYVTLRKGTIINVLLSYIIPSWDKDKVENYTIEGMDVNETLKIDQFRMQNSIDTAIIVAYKKAGAEIKITGEEAYVIYIADKSKTELQLLDKIISIDGLDIKTISDIQNYVNNHKIGDVLNIKVERDNKNIDVKSTVFDYNGSPKIGISILPRFVYETTPHIELKTSPSEAGSSRGLMTTLAIYSRLINEDITHGKDIIGTGTIDINGNVGEIDGVKYKVLGAARNKADIFLCPKENYDEAISVKKKHKLKIDIVSVSNFDEALNYLEKLA